MSQSGELLKKADALLGRYGRRSTEAETDFPVLTEVVEPREGPPGLPPVDLVLTDVVDRIEPRPLSGAPGAVSDATGGDGGDAPDQTVREQALRLELHAAALEDLRESLAGLPMVVGPALEHSLNQHLDQAIAELSEKMRQEVHAMVLSAVEEAVQRAIDSLQPPPSHD